MNTLMERQIVSQPGSFKGLLGMNKITFWGGDYKESGIFLKGEWGL